jgi:hypothetical protein
MRALSAALAAVCLTLSPLAHAASAQDAGIRHAAQQGLVWMSGAAQQWTQQHSCYGCHVQAVTLEGLTVGKHNHYDIAPSDLDAMVKAMLLGPTAGGHTTGVAFQGAAWARYDQWIDAQQTAQLLKYARELIGLQQPDGSVQDDDTRKPVIAGTMQTTFQAMQTWRQAYARTADDLWLPPMRRAERYLSVSSSNWTAKSDVYLQDANYALLGLIAAGVGSGENSTQRLQQMVLARQNHDGGWGLAEGKSDVIATGQSLYALKMAGLADQDPAISKGMAWLVERQRTDGSWHQDSNQGGADKGATMWAVLGLVTVDVVSVSVNGVVDGQHVAEAMALQIDARDNQGKGVAKVEILLDDLPVRSVSASSLAYTWDTRKLTEGKHVLQVVATSNKGEKAERRFEVYAGNVFLTQVGTRFDEQRQLTEVSFRDLDAAGAGHVTLEVFAADDGKGEPKMGKKIFAEDEKGTPGGMTLTWNGKSQEGQLQPKGRYYAQLVFKDAAGKAVQTERTLFFHDSEQVQRQKFGEVQGKLGLHAGAGASSNTEVELVDHDGRVVQVTRTTEQGNYRFKNVDKGDYLVRAKKEGFRALEAPVSAAPAKEPADASMSW